MIVIIDYGMGNIGSVLNMLKKNGARVCVSSNPETISQGNKLILPGVGAFDKGMESLAAKGVIDVLNEKVLIAKTPILGICLGAQLLARISGEGTRPGLGWIDAEVVRFQFPESCNGLKVPHMGWNEVEIKREDPLLTGFNESPRFYFVHSYYMNCMQQKDISATAFYGIEFPAIVRKGNIMGTQFHPEKSHKFGLRLLKNFVEM